MIFYIILPKKGKSIQDFILQIYQIISDQLIYYLLIQSNIFQVQDEDTVLALTQDDLNIQKTLDSSYWRKSSMKLFQRFHEWVIEKNIANIKKNKLNNFQCQLKRRNKRESSQNRRLKHINLRLNDSDRIKSLKFLNNNYKNMFSGNSKNIDELNKQKI
ncbi:unnamed protein product [Paramecium pentaurelia]|uniref:Uncharacterized protein n=1 Tax=Paramecium pentaurelia TaxID=43138 RepID=A0A8S1S0C4_9CILI|nr:unnamed protein product [Paramecium pentaurelia]